MKRRGESFHFYAVARIGSDVSLSIRLHNVVTFRDGGQPSAEIGGGRKKGGRRNGGKEIRRVGPWREN